MTGTAEPIPTLIAADVSQTLRDLLERDVRFAVTWQPCRDEESLRRAIGPHQLLVTRHYNRVTAEVIDSAPALRLIAQGTSGLDNIAENRATERGIAVVSTPGENANAVAELVVSHMIALTRTVPLYHRMTMQGIWSRDDCATRHELRAHRVGIVGLGRVGGRVARLLAAFGVGCIAYDPYITDEEALLRGATRIHSLEELLNRADILTLHVPLTDETRNMIGAPQLDLLAPGSFVINSSRGEVLDLRAVLERLRLGSVAGAALDVYDPEPPAAFEGVDDTRLILTPHIAGCSHESKASIGANLYRQICAFFGFTPLQ